MVESSRSISRLARMIEAAEADPRNRIVEKFLIHRVEEIGLTCGTSCAYDILKFMRQSSIDPPERIEYPIYWVNRQLKDALLAGLEYFEIREVEGTRSGVNFAWWFKDEKPIDRSVKLDSDRPVDSPSIRQRPIYDRI